ncbi:hypothetical protein KQR54_18585 [Mycobacterium gordonae]|uniref:hypothetical protein n=1 Tax=Mycobacterium gordonae TaxID=1778 RepID=UPI0021092635|nr:hypothetical protein [Mycobacterium gordonae]MBX9983339.1 hypothetical protein [Mycobacterium gordonae]MCQ4363108.1 hypothetical protein [Mycobacterium gordonae]
MTSGTRDDPVARVDALVASRGPKVGPPVIGRRDVVLVTGPWLAGVSSVAAALRQRIPQHTFVESGELRAGDAPTGVVFVVSAAAPMTASDCLLLDAAAENTDAVVAVVAKVDVHFGWRDVLDTNRRLLTAHAPRYGKVSWVGVAAAPEVGAPQVDDLVVTVAAQLADSDLARRNRLRAWESRLRTAAQRFDRDADGAGRRARVEALREERSTTLRQRRQSRSERTITLRGQIQQARVQLSYAARTRVAELRGELQEDVARLSRRQLPGFPAAAQARLDEVAGEIAAGCDVHLGEVAAAMGVPLDLPAITAPSVPVSAPALKSRQLEMRLMMVFGAVFGLGVALTLSRVVAGLAPDLHPGLTAAGIAACVGLGLATTAWVVSVRSLLSDRAVLDRWVEDATSSLRSAAEQTVASRVLAAESLLSTAASTHDEAESVRVADQVSAIDGELREHGLAAARAAAVRDREMPTIQAALDAIRAELGEPGMPGQGGIARAETSMRYDGRSF